MKAPEKEVFAGLLESRNPEAFRSYRYALFGLIPVAGLALGALAIGLGILGEKRAKQDPKREGLSQARAAIFLGTLEVLTNGVGLTLIAVGLVEVLR